MPHHMGGSVLDNEKTLRCVIRCDFSEWLVINLDALVVYWCCMEKTALNHAFFLSS